MVTARQRNRALLARQGLLERSAQPFPRVLEQMAGLQAQYAPSMYVGLWSRVAGFTRDQLTTALRDRRVAQGTLLRATIHLVTARDYWPFELAVRDRRRDWYLRVARPRPDPAQLEAAADRLRAVGDAVLTRADLEGVVGRANLAAAGMLVPLVRVPPSGTWERRRADLFALAEVWLGPPAVTPPEGLVHLVRRYLGGFGPATRKDIAAYCGLTGAQVQPALDELDLLRLRSESGAELLDLRGAPRPDADTTAPVRFLPTWDSTLLTHCRETGILPEEHRPRIFHTKNPQSTPVFLVDGVVSGTWRHTEGTVEVTPFAELPRGPRDEVHEEAERLAAFHA